VTEHCYAEERLITNDSFIADDNEEDRRPSMTQDHDYIEIAKYNRGTPTYYNIEIETPGGSSNGLVDAKLGLKQTDTVPIGTSPTGSAVMGTPTTSPLRSEKRRAEEVNEGPAKRVKTIDYSQWKNDYPGPEEEPHPDLVYRVQGFTEYKRTGANINREYRRKKEFKNPDILEKLVKYYNIIEIGSNYPASKFDPYKWKATSFYDALAEEQQRMMEKLESEKKGTKTKSSGKSSAKSKKSNTGPSTSKVKEKDRERGSRTKKEKDIKKHKNKTQWDIGAEKETSESKRMNSDIFS